MLADQLIGDFTNRKRSGKKLKATLQQRKKLEEPIIDIKLFPMLANTYLKRAADIILGMQSKQKLSQIPPSDNSVKRRIDDMAEDIKNQVVDAVKQSLFFAIQLDESTDIAQYSQLIVYVRYIENKRMKDELLLSTKLDATTKAIDVMKAVSDFFDKHELSWQKLIGACTDGEISNRKMLM
ncbi:protein FAM200C-like [Diabrotica undecimpunctata]|uniref:protein FAM200C-like n=1 Tax=Diabrotica undecimpunctata TaxID=50387 RepID=UPI003B63AF50